MSGLPEVMDAAVYQSPGVVTVEERPVPIPAQGEVLLAIDHCGICGSDIHMLLDGWGNKPGLIAGHEFTGTIAALGEGVSGWQVGERVVGGPTPKCGTCRRCREGKPSQCENRDFEVIGNHDGAFADYAIVQGSSLLRVPEGLSTRDAALAEPLAVALHGITRSQIQPGDSAMVFGAGPIGTLTIAALRAKGHGPITVVEPSQTRRALARDLGADSVLDPSELPVFPLWEPEHISPFATHIVYECSGKKAAMEMAFNQLKRGGTLVLVGAGIEPPTFDPNRMILNELSVCGSFIYDRDGFERALELLASGALDTSLLIEPGEVSLGGISEALVGLARGQIGGKVMVVPSQAKAAS